MSSVRKLFVEGGGDNDALRTECRRAFTALLKNAEFKGRLPRIVACGSRRNAYEQFCTALATDPDSCLLLVDSEDPVVGTSAWEHVQRRQGDFWPKPRGAEEDHLHLMVQSMEAWLVADLSCLVSFYGKGFRTSDLERAANAPESAAKEELVKVLRQATRQTSKGVYDKGQHSFKLLALMDPKRLRRPVSTWAKRFFETLDKRL